MYYLPRGRGTESRYFLGGYVSLQKHLGMTLAALAAVALVACSGGDQFAAETKMVYYALPG